MDHNNIINGINEYNIEGSEAGSWKFKIIKGIELINNELIEAIKNFNKTIFFNDSSSRHWFFDYKVNNTWIEASEINCNTMTIDLILS